MVPTEQLMAEMERKEQEKKLDNYSYGDDKVEEETDRILGKSL